MQKFPYFGPHTNLKKNLVWGLFVITVVPPNTADLGTDEKVAVTIFKQEKPCLGLENGWQYWGRR